MNFSKIFSYTSLVVSLLFISFVAYKSEIIFSGNRINYYSIYYIIGFFFFSFSIISFYLNSKVKLILTIIFISLLFSLYSFEGLLQLGLFKGNSLADQRIHLAKEQGINFDKRSRYKVYTELKENKEEVTIVIHPSQFINHSYDIMTLAGISKKRTVHCNENGYFSIYDSDRYGFNNPDHEWNKDEIKFLLIGDSFVHGSCVNEKDTISGNLRKKLKNKGVINLGYKGTGPLIQNAILREYGSQLKYKNLLWFYFGNDIEDLAYELNNEILNKYFLDNSFTQNLARKQDEVDLFLEDYLFQIESNKNNIQSFIKLSLIRKMIFFKYLENNNAQKKLQNSDNNLENFKKMMAMSKKISDLNKSNIYFIYLPMFNRYDSELKLVDSGQNFYDQIISIINELKIPIIDIHKELFQQEGNPKKLFPFGIRGHYTADTYNMISDIIIDRIDQLEK